MRSSRLLIAGVATLTIALAPAPAAAQAPECVPAGERIPEPTRDGYGLGPLLPGPTCPPGDGGGAPGGDARGGFSGLDGAPAGFSGLDGAPPGTGGAGSGATLPPLASTPVGLVGGGPQGTDGEIGGDTSGGRGASDDGASGGGGPPGDPSEAGGPAQVLGDVLSGDEGLAWRTPSGIPPSEPAWTGPLAGVRGLSVLDLAVGAGLLLALAAVGARLARPNPATV